MKKIGRKLKGLLISISENGIMCTNVQEKLVEAQFSKNILIFEIGGFM